MLILVLFMAICIGVIVVLILWDRRETRRGERLAREYWETLKEIRTMNHKKKEEDGKQ